MVKCVSKYIFLISKNKQTTKKHKKTKKTTRIQKKEKETEKEKRIFPENRLKK